MAWSWSHTQEAYDNARANLAELPYDALREAYCEWLASDESERHTIDTERYDFHMQTFGDWPKDQLVDTLWDYASEQATCDNGGWNAWICPQGCHTVPFDRQEH